MLGSRTFEAIINRKCDWLPSEIRNVIFSQVLKNVNLKEMGCPRPRYSSFGIRILYFFAGKAAGVVSHGLTKEREVPPREIDRAIMRKMLTERDFKKYTYKPE